MRRVSLVLSPLVALIVGCGGDPPKPGVAEVGAAYLAFDGAGVFRLADGRVSPVEGPPKRYTDELAIGGGGALYTCGQNGIHRVTKAGGTVELSKRICDHVASDGKSVWAAAHPGIVQIVDGVEKALFDSEQTFHYPRADTIFIAEEGGVYALAGWPFHWTGEVWERLEIVPRVAGGARPELLFNAFAQAPGGPAYLIQDSNLLRVEGGKATVVTELDQMGLTDLAISPTSGNIYIAQAHENVLVVSPAGERVRDYAKDGPSIGGRVRSLAVDAAERLWVVTPDELVLITPDGQRFDWSWASLGIDGIKRSRKGVNRAEKIVLKGIPAPPRG